MTTLARPPHTSWASAHATLLAFVALSVAVLAAAVVAVTLSAGRSSVDPVTRPVAPPAQEDTACGGTSLRLLAIPFC